MSVMRNHSSHMDLQLNGCHLLDMLLHHGAACGPDAVALVLAAMRLNSAHVCLQLTAVFFMITVLSSRADQSAQPDHPEMILAIVAALRCHPMKQLQHVCWAALSWLLIHPSNAHLVREAGATPPLLNFVRTNLSDAAELVCGFKSLQALAPLCADDSVVCADIMSAVAAALRAHPAHEKLHMHGSKVLHTLAHSEITSHEMNPCSKGAVDAVIQALRTHRHSLPVLEGAMSALASLVDNVEVASYAVSVDAIGAVQAAMQAHRKSPHVALLACMIFRALASSPGDHVHVLEARAFEVMLEVLRTPKLAPKLQDVAYGMLLTLLKADAPCVHNVFTAGMLAKLP